MQRRVIISMQISLRQIYKYTWLESIIQCNIYFGDFVNVNNMNFVAFSKDRKKTTTAVANSIYFSWSLPHETLKVGQVHCSASYLVSRRIKKNYCLFLQSYQSHTHINYSSMVRDKGYQLITGTWLCYCSQRTNSLESHSITKHFAQGTRSFIPQLRYLFESC